MNDLAGDAGRKRWTQEPSEEYKQAHPGWNKEPEPEPPPPRGTLHGKLCVFRVADIDTADQRGYLLKGLISPAEISVWVGAPKCGKSFWTFDLMMHVARGTPYRGRRVQQGIVVYVALEGDEGFRRRIEAYKRHHCIADAPFYLITDRTDLVRDHEALIARVKDLHDTVVQQTTQQIERTKTASVKKITDMKANMKKQVDGVVQQATAKMDAAKKK